MTNFSRHLGIENKFTRAITSLGKYVKGILHSFVGTDLIDTSSKITNSFQQYSQFIEPWAENITTGLVNDISKHTAKILSQSSKHRETSAYLRADEQIRRDTEAYLSSFLKEQLDLIKSIPLKASEHLHDIAFNHLLKNELGLQADIEHYLLSLGEVTERKAAGIARDIVGKAHTGLLMIKSIQVGSKGYIWIVTNDNKLRPSHRTMMNKFVEWNNPPTLDDLTGHAGCLPFCRCHPAPVLPASLFEDVR